MNSFVYVLNGVEVSRGQMSVYLGKFYGINPNDAILMREQIAVNQLQSPMVAVSINPQDGSVLYYR